MQEILLVTKNYKLKEQIEELKSLNSSNNTLDILEKKIERLKLQQNCQDRCNGNYKNDMIHDTPWAIMSLHLIFK